MDRMIEPSQSHRHPCKRRVRARAHRRRCMQATTNHVSPTPCRRKRHCKSEGGKRLGSCSRDPIGYAGSAWNLYHYVNSSPMVMLDSNGLAGRPTCDASIAVGSGNQIDGPFPPPADSVWVTSWNRPCIRLHPCSIFYFGSRPCTQICVCRLLTGPRLFGWRTTYFWECDTECGDCD